MYTQKINHKITVLIAALFITLFSACRHDETIDTISPAYHIAESNKLLIPASVDLPENLPAGNTRVATYFAAGVQKYKAQVKAGSSPVTYEWVLVGPDATLYDNSNTAVGTHTVGPSWQLTGSTTDSIFAQHFSPARTAPSPQPNSVDWLLLMPKAGKTPTGIFSDVSYIQRIATSGGKAPAALPINGDETINVQYTAVYRFTKKN